METDIETQTERHKRRQDKDTDGDTEMLSVSQIVLVKSRGTGERIGKKSAVGKSITKTRLNHNTVPHYPQPPSQR